VVVGSTVVVVVASRAAVVVVAPTVVVVGSRVVVVVGSTVVVVGSIVLSGAGWDSVVVGAAAGGGLEELGGSLTRAVGRGVAVVAARLPGEAGAAADGGCGGSAGAPVVDDLAGRVLEGATEGAGPLVAGAAVLSVGRAPTPVGAGGVWETRAAEATIAARTAKVSPKATSMSRRGSRRSARWRGVRVGMGCCRTVRLWLGLRILGIVRSNGKSRWVIMG
jgi:hypothetical protein